jgi:hypothetical protein
LDNSFGDDVDAMIRGLLDNNRRRSFIHRGSEIFVPFEPPIHLPR